MNAIDARPACPRCGKPGQRNHDEWMCFDHGTFVVVPRAGDPAGFDLADALALGVRRDSFALPSPAWVARERQEWDTWEEGAPVPAWAGGDETELHRRTAERSRQAESLLQLGHHPSGIASQMNLSLRTVYRLLGRKDEEMTQPTPPKEELSASDLVRLTKNRAETLAVKARTALKVLESCQEEGAKLLGFLRAMGEDYELPDELRSHHKIPKRAGQRAVKACDECDYVGVGLGIHRRHKHGRVSL